MRRRGPKGHLSLAGQASPSTKAPRAYGGTKRQRWMSDMDPPRIELLLVAEKMAKKASALVDAGDMVALDTASRLTEAASRALDVASRVLLTDNWRITSLLQDYEDSVTPEEPAKDHQ